MKSADPMSGRRDGRRGAWAWPALLAVGAVLLGTSWAAAEGILSSKHNLSSSGTNSVKGTTNEVCIYCHTPHHADATLSPQGVPLWNRNIAGSSPSYTMYSSPTLDSTPDTTPSGVSRACLSCHDGTLGINQLLNGAGSGLGTRPSNTSDTKETGVVLLATPGTGNVVDLRDDHPISMRYSQAKSPNGSYTTSATNGANSLAGGTNSGFNTKTYAETQGLKFFNGVEPAGNGDYVQCASCHDPHNAGTNTFLRISNTNSALCLTCHNKNGSTPQ